MNELFEVRTEFENSLHKNFGPSIALDGKSNPVDKLFIISQQRRYSEIHRKSQ